MSLEHLVLGHTAKDFDSRPRPQILALRLWPRINITAVFCRELDPVDKVRVNLHPSLAISLAVFWFLFNTLMLSCKGKVNVVPYSLWALATELFLVSMQSAYRWQVINPDSWLPSLLTIPWLPYQPKRSPILCFSVLCHYLRLNKFKVKYDLRKYYFTSRVVNVRNSLSSFVVSVDCFKK